MEYLQETDYSMVANGSLEEKNVTVLLMNVSGTNIIIIYTLAYELMRNNAQ